MSTARLSELRLRAFKSFRDVTLPLGPVTVLIGRNSSGKSNALDGLETLARLATGQSLADALDGRRREAGAVRGGSAGLPPHGSSTFALGCTVELGEDRYRYDVEVQVSPYPMILHETFTAQGVSSALETLFEAHLVRQPAFLVPEENDPSPSLQEVWTPELWGTVSDHRGAEPLEFRIDRLALTQLTTALAGTTQAERRVLRGAETVLTALRGVFHLDPVPHLMRGYVPERDSQLRRTAENLSAALQRLGKQEPTTLSTIEQHLRGVVDEGVQQISFASSELGDVMMVLDEQRGGALERTPAREMSDGLLRFTAVAAALLSSRHLDIEETLPRTGSHDATDGAVQIVIEELENGLHPSQASRVLDLVRDAAQDQTRVLVTTHSPALLDAAEGILNDSILLCHRDLTSGHSQITALRKLPGYARALAERTLGSAVATDALLADDTEQDHHEFKQLLGLR
ncbi:MAG: AAA family ATPase [Actinomycetia bacterium]|nr:AAA family ATPase [Actinomycetes bacterium]